MRQKEEKIIIVLLAIVTSVALIGIGFLASRLIALRQADTPTQVAQEGIDEALAALDRLEREGFYYEYHFQQDIPISSDIPIQQDLVFPVEGTIPINTTVAVPVNLGPAGRINLEIPIKTNIYVNTSVPLHVDQTFHLSTTVPLSLTIPINVPPGDPAVRELINPIREWLVRFKESF